MSRGAGASKVCPHRYFYLIKLLQEELNYKKAALRQLEGHDYDLFDEPSFFIEQKEVLTLDIEKLKTALSSYKKEHRKLKKQLS